MRPTDLSVDTRGWDGQVPIMRCSRRGAGRLVEREWSVEKNDRTSFNLVAELAGQVVALVVLQLRGTVFVRVRVASPGVLGAARPVRRMLPPALGVLALAKVPPPPRTEAELREDAEVAAAQRELCLLYTSPSPRDGLLSRMPSSA